MIRKNISALKYVFIFVLLVCNAPLFAQHPENPGKENESWQILQKAQSAFDRQDFGLSLKYLQNCLEQRKKEIIWKTYVLNNALKPYQVRKEGDYIDDVLNVLKEREEYEAIEIIENLCTKKGKEFFSGSAKKIVEYIEKTSDYPEAYFLIGKIYKLEGEFNLALEYFEKARASSSLLEIPAQKISILYEIADIAENTKDVPTQEKALILIVQDDGYYQNETVKKALLRSAKVINEDYSSKFFTLYRIDAISTVKAYFDLSKIYSSAGKYKDAFITNLYSVLISFTHINSILEERESEYTYTDLKSFFDEISRYPDILKWCNDNKFWESFFNIYEYGIRSDAPRFGKDILSAMSKDCPDSYWKKAAEEKINSIEQN